jgi:hypothetical protein
MMDVDDEVELRRYDSAFDAELALGFLREHGVRARLKGSGTSSILDRFTTVVDIRLVVPRASREAGERALEAMSMNEDEAMASARGREEPAGAVPYRGAGPTADDDGPVIHDQRYRRGVIVGVVFPGGAHLYARQAVMGWILFAAILGFWVVGAVTGQRWMGLAGFLLGFYDIAHGVLAVERHNAGKDPPARAQVVHGLFAVLAMSVASMVLVAIRPPRDPSSDAAPSAPSTELVPAR